MSNDPQQNETLASLWRQLTPEQRRYVVARCESSSVQAAAEKAGISRAAVYRWGRIVEEAVALMQKDVADSARVMLTEALTSAALGKIGEMSSGDALIAARARTEILDRGLGKPVARQELDMKGEMNISSSTLEDALALVKERASKLSDEHE